MYGIPDERSRKKCEASVTKDFQNEWQKPNSCSKGTRMPSKIKKTKCSLNLGKSSTMENTRDKTLTPR